MRRFLKALFIAWLSKKLFSRMARSDDSAGESTAPRKRGGRR